MFSSIKMLKEALASGILGMFRFNLPESSEDTGQKKKRKSNNIRTTDRGHHRK